MAYAFVGSNPTPCTTYMSNYDPHRFAETQSTHGLVYNPLGNIDADYLLDNQHNLGLLQEMMGSTAYDAVVAQG